MYIHLSLSFKLSIYVSIYLSTHFALDSPSRSSDLYRCRSLSVVGYINAPADAIAPTRISCKSLGTSPVRACAWVVVSVCVRVCVPACLA